MVFGYYFKFKYLLYLLDVLIIDLCLLAFFWVDFCIIKGVVKLYVGLNYVGYLLEFVIIIEGKKYDIIVGWMFNFLKGSMVVIDKVYNDYDWYK